MGQLVGDISAWAGNVSTSVAIVFVNKMLMSTTGYGFKYGERTCPCKKIATNAPWPLDLGLMHGRSVLGYKLINLTATEPDLYVAATTLSALHYVACSLSVWSVQVLGGVTRVALSTTGISLLPQ